MYRSYIKNRKGFTLIELLVAVAIIATLSAIVVSSINQSRERSENNTIIRQVREYRTALDIAYGANGNFYPHFSLVTSNSYYRSPENEIIIESEIRCLAETRGVGSQECNWGDDSVARVVIQDGDAGGVIGMAAFEAAINTGPLPVVVYDSSGDDYDSIMYFAGKGGDEYAIRYPLKGDNTDCGFDDASDVSVVGDGITLCEFIQW